MEFRVIGSGSSGNCYLLTNGQESLVIEAGLPFGEVKKHIKDLRTIKGCITTHEHKDHCKYVKDYVDSGIVTGMTKAVAEQFEYGFFIREWKDKMRTVFGNFMVDSFLVEHDVECYGFLIKHPEMGTMVFLTDTEYCQYKFSNVNHIMVETNYSQKIIDDNVATGDIPESLRNRIMKSHMSYDTARRLVEANKSDSLYNVCLLHLSGHNSDRKAFREDMQSVVSDTMCQVHIAEPGTVITVNKAPF